MGIQVAFGKGPWKPAEEFLGYSYGSLLRFVSSVNLPVRFHSLTANALPAIASSISPTILTACDGEESVPRITSVALFPLSIAILEPDP